MFKQKIMRNRVALNCFLIGLASFIVMLEQAGFAADPDRVERPAYSPVIRQNEDWSTFLIGEKNVFRQLV
jgi:hypothetical protein